MADCPVCETPYLKGKSERCHVCGWQLNASGFSMIGPVKIEHQLSRATLTQIEAWAHHMWTTIQQQKKQITHLQTHQRSPQIAPQALPTVKLPQAQTSGMMMTPAGTEAIAASSSTPTSSTTPSELLQWVLSRLETAEQERSQLQFQVSQLRAQLQRQTEAISLQPPSLLPEASTSDDPAWQSDLERMETQLQHTQITSQQQIQEAIAPLMSSNQVQQQTLLMLQNTVQTIQHQLQEQNQALQALQQQSIDLTQQMETVKLDLSDHRLETLEQQLRSLSDQLAALEQQFTTQVEEQLAPLQEQWQQTADAVSEFTEQLHTLKNQLQTQHNQAVQATQERIDQVQRAGQQLQTELRQLSQSDHPAQSAFTKVTEQQQTQIEALITQVQALETKVAPQPSSTAAPMANSDLGPGRSSHNVYTRYH